MFQYLFVFFLKFIDLCTCIQWINYDNAEICSIVFTDGNKNTNSFANTNLGLLLNDIENIIKN